VKGRDPAWQDAEKGAVHKKVLDHVASIEQAQLETFNRFLRLSYLYDPNNGRMPSDVDERSTRVDSQVTENFIASNVDTVYAAIAASDVSARFTPDDGDWETQRRARYLEFYAEGLRRLVGAADKGRRGFKDCALKGTGPVKVWVDEFDRIRCERLLIDNVVVDETECRDGREPRQMHYREVLSEDEALARFPGEQAAAAIRSASGRGDLKADRYWADYRPLNRDEVVIVESWYRPIGVKGKKGYKPGRHTIVCDGFDLLDDKWHKDYFPIAVIRWSDKDAGWYGIGLAERIAGHQRANNKLNIQQDRCIDQFAFPMTWARVQEANLIVKTVPRYGPLGLYKTEPPRTVIPPAVSPDLTNRRNDLRQSAFHEAGVSEMAAHAAKPAGFDSGAALREYRDSTSQRFSQQEKRYEEFQLDITLRLLECAKELGAKAPEVFRKSRFGAKKIKWSDVDMGEARIQMQAASDLSKTPAGRLQLALEWAQAGVISQDEARRLMRTRDTEETISIFTASLDHIIRVLDEGLDGNFITPEPYMNLRMAVWRGTMTLQKADDDGAPENILEIIRQFVDTASWMVAQSEATAPQVAPMAAGDPMAAESAALPATPMPGQAEAGPTMTGAGVSPLALVQ